MVVGGASSPLCAMQLGFASSRGHFLFFLSFLVLYLVLGLCPLIIPLHEELSLHEELK